MTACALPDTRREPERAVWMLAEEMIKATTDAGYPRRFTSDRDRTSTGVGADVP